MLICYCNPINDYINPINLVFLLYNLQEIDIKKLRKII